MKYVFLEQFYNFPGSPTCASLTPSAACDIPMLDHVRRIVHGSGAIYISLRLITLCYILPGSPTPASHIPVLPLPVIYQCWTTYAELSTAVVLFISHYVGSLILIYYCQGVVLVPAILLPFCCLWYTHVRPCTQNCPWQWRYLYLAASADQYCPWGRKSNYDVELV